MTEHTQPPVLPWDAHNVMDQVIKHDLPQGPAWRRYNHNKGAVHVECHHIADRLNHLKS